MVSDTKDFCGSEWAGVKTIWTQGYVHSADKMFPKTATFLRKGHKSSCLFYVFAGDENDTVHFELEEERDGSLASNLRHWSRYVPLFFPLPFATPVRYSE